MDKANKNQASKLDALKGTVQDDVLKKAIDKKVQVLTSGKTVEK